jgi:hypothetical protein
MWLVFQRKIILWNVNGKGLPLALSVKKTKAANTCSLSVPLPNM